jgi:hypothetical protein
MTDKKEALGQDDFDRIVADLKALGSLFPPPKQPMPVARQLMGARNFRGLPTLKHWRDSWMQWEQAHWVEIEERTVRAVIYERLEEAEYMTPFGSEAWEPNRYKITDVMDALRSITHLPASYHTPCWLPGTAGTDSPVIAAANGCSMSTLGSFGRSRLGSSAWSRYRSPTTRTHRRRQRRWNSSISCGQTTSKQSRHCATGLVTS